MSLRTLKVVLALTMAGFIVAAIYISVLVVERQGALRQISRYNAAWEANQAASEFNRFEQRLSEFAIAGSSVDKEEVELRYEILLGRAKLLNESSFHALLQYNPDHQDTIHALDQTLTVIKPLIDDLHRPGAPQQVLEILKPLETKLGQLASVAHNFGAELVAKDQQELIRLHWIFSSIAIGLILLGVLLILLLSRHIRLLGRAHQELNNLAHRDALTGLPNRAVLREELEVALSSGIGKDHTVSVSYLDLDRFKDINDSFGHEMGDRLLVAVAERLQNCVEFNQEERSRVVITRLGGDEFAILQMDVRNPDERAELAANIVEALRKPFSIEGQEIYIGTSIGIALAQNGVTSSQILKHADMALYQAKADGRDTYRFFEPEMDEQLQARRLLESDLRKALGNSEFQLFYQPQVNIQKNEIVGFEALLRWHHPERGPVPPVEFIPIAEDTGMISLLGDWVIEQACREASTWTKRGNVAVNLSPVQFRNGNLVQSVRRALELSGLAPDRLELEITESVLLQDNETTIATLHQLRNLGVQIAMDDFGTGYSSLSYLRSFPFDKIKIDQSFVRGLSTRADCLAIVRSIATLGADLGMPTVAEGVETEDQLLQIRAAGCTEVQGYYFGRPKPAQELVHTLDACRSMTEVA